MGQREGVVEGVVEDIGGVGMVLGEFDGYIGGVPEALLEGCGMDVV